MAVDPEVLRALERLVVDDPANRGVRLHLVDLLIEDGQHAAALGHCEALARAGDDGPDVAARAAAARAGLGAPAEPRPERVARGGPGGEPPTVEELSDLVRPEVTLADVAGMDEVKQRLRTSFLEPLRNPEVRAAYGTSLRSGLLLWGPPGCGKTFLARAVAGELGLYAIHLGLTEVLDMWLGSSERNLHEVFEEARRMSPTVLFLDELDALGHARSRLRASGGARNVVNQLLLELDGAASANEGLLVLGATNQPWDLDPALLRPGRFDRQVLVLPPDAPARAAILAHHLGRAPLGPLDLTAVATRTEGFSGADLAHLADRAVEAAMHEALRAGATVPVTQDHLERALADSPPPSTDAWLRQAESYVKFSDDDERYRELRAYLDRRRGRRRR